MDEIQRIRKLIKEYAQHGLYSANCIEVKMLYKQLRELKNREPVPNEDYTEMFIDGSDVPINGNYE